MRAASTHAISWDPGCQGDTLEDQKPETCHERAQAYERGVSNTTTQEREIPLFSGRWKSYSEVVVFSK